MEIESRKCSLKNCSSFVMRTKEVGVSRREPVIKQLFSLAVSGSTSPVLGYSIRIGERG